jgi:hypothetical protein
VFLRLAGVTAGWNPSTDPFDAKTAHALRPVIIQLRTQSQSATTGELRVSVGKNAAALAALESAMRSGRRQQVTRALAKSRHAYAALPSCARRGHARAAHPSTTTGVKGGSNGPPTGPLGPAQTGITPAAAQDPGCKAAKAAYAKLGPVTAKWDINTDPFDAAVAAGFRSTADALDAAASASKIGRVSSRATANADAFRRLADAMGSKDASQVDDSVITMQQAAVTLAATCPLS